MKEAAHLADMARAARDSTMRELTLQMQLRDARAETALAEERAEHAAAIAMLTRTATVRPPGPIMVMASDERESFIGRQLVPFNTEALIKASGIRPGTPAETISAA